MDLKISSLLGFEERIVAADGSDPFRRILTQVVYRDSGRLRGHYKISGSFQGRNLCQILESLDQAVEFYNSLETEAGVDEG